MSDGDAGGQQSCCSGTEAGFGKYVNLQAQGLQNEWLFQVGSLVCALLAQLSHQGASP